MPPSPPTPPDRDRERLQSVNATAAAAPHAELLCEDSGQLENLNEKQLRALLDEAVTYKRPKDREGKSSLFKNLLYKAEQASEEELQLACSSIGSFGANCGKRGRAKRSLTHFPHSGSLQDLAGAGSGPDVRLPRPHTRHRRPVPVSARSLHGGSLPANVDQQYFGTFLEDVRCGTSAGIKPRISGNDYIATVKCINPPPLGEPSNPDYMVLNVATNESDRVSSPPVQQPVANSPQPIHTSGYFDDDEGTEMDYIRPQKNLYTSRAALEIISPTMTVGDSTADRTPNVLNLVDSNQGCITSPAVTQTPPSSGLETKPLQLPSSYCAVRSVTGPTSIDGNSSTNSSSTSGSFPVIPNTHNLNVINILQSQSHQFQHESDKKNFDENYNAVQNIGSITGTSQPNQKKSKRKKLYKNETQTLAELIDGYRGDEKLDDIIKFIESDADNVKHHGKNQSKSNTGIGINGKVASIRENKSKDDTDNDKISKKRSTERRVKDKLETKLKRANSMEELSRRKFDDLTSTKDSLTFRKTKKTSVFEAASVSNGKNNERRSWCSDESEPYCKTDNRNNDSEERTSPVDLSISASSNTDKQKKSKPSLTDVDVSVVEYDPFYAIETSDFQTVTKKKKIRKRHSPTDEGRNKSNFYSHNMQNMRPSNGGRSNQERDTMYKRFGNGPHPSVSSPPSDKSNDSNDDLDSVHSLPADASGERYQASYADMARAAPPASPPPSMAPLARQHNFPDLIESCNYYTNDIITIQDKHFDISMENSKNLSLKDNSTDYDSNKSIKTTCLDLGNQPDLNIHKAYIREQYPALESRQKACNKVTLKSKVDNNKFHNHKTYVDKQGDESAKSRDETVIISGAMTVGSEDISSEQYVNYLKNSVTDNTLTGNSLFTNIKANKIGHSNNKIDGPSKPPDVVLPLAEINSSFESRPPVIIMNEEPNRSSDDIQNMNGITFGFDINEQLINGETTSIALQASDSVEYSDSVEAMDPPTTVVYNSNVDFPAINEKPFRESNDKSKVVSDDSKHSKKPNRATVKDGIKFVSKSNNCSDPSRLKTEDSNDTTKDEAAQSEGQVVETCVGGDKALRYLAPTATTKDIYNLDRIVHYVGMAWENIIKTSGDKIRYFSDQQ